MAYLSFLNQLSLLNQIPTCDLDSMLARSKQLDAVTKTLQETLDKHFG